MLNTTPMSICFMIRKLNQLYLVGGTLITLENHDFGNIRNIPTEGKLYVFQTIHQLPSGNDKHFEAMDQLK